MMKSFNTLFVVVVYIWFGDKIAFVLAKKNYCNVGSLYCDAGNHMFMMGSCNGLNLFQGLPDSGKENIFIPISRCLPSS